MNKDQVRGKAKDIAGRVERQAGEWTADKEKQAHGAMKQVEGKVQNAWGNVKDAGKKTAKKGKAGRDEEPVDGSIESDADGEDVRSRRKAG